MSQSLTQIFSELHTLWTNPDSYAIVEKQKQSDDDFKTKLVNLFSNMKSLDTIAVQQIENMLTNIIIQIGMEIDCYNLKQFLEKIDYSNLKQFLEQIQNNTENVCSHFVDNINICESFNDDTVIPVSVLFSAMLCKSCHHFKEEHTACKKYVVTKYSILLDKPCITCGLDGFDHMCCMNYIVSENRLCESCGHDLFTHQEKAKKSGLTHCNNFVKSEKSMHCANCIHCESDHYMNPKLLTMNKDAFNKFTDLSLKFFCGISPENNLENNDIIIKVVCMNYTKSHPMYRTYFKPSTALI